MSLGQIIRQWRGAENQTDFARRAGVAQSDISKYERNLKQPELATLRKLATAAGQPLDAVVALVFPEHEQTRARGQRGQPTERPLPPLPPVTEIIRTITAFRELLDRMVAALVSGDICCHPTQKPRRRRKSGGKKGRRAL